MEAFRVFQPGLLSPVLGQTFRVSRITVRRALGDPQKEGLIFKAHGKVTVVVKSKMFQSVSIRQGLAESVTPIGYALLSRVPSFEQMPASASACRCLG